VPVNADSSCWTKPLADGSIAALLLNTGDSTSAVTCTFAELNVKSASAKVRDLWAKKDLGTLFGNITATLKTHVAMVVKITPA
jgi:alpha-galactosidase